MTLLLLHRVSPILGCAHSLTGGVGDPSCGSTLGRMLTGFGCDLGDAAAVARLAAVAHELASACDGIDDLITGARSLAADTAWSARAAESFFTAAEEWAGEVSSLRCLLETARGQTRQAQALAALPRGACQ